jgi:uncharacterized protein
MSSQQLTEALRDPACYPHPGDSSVVVHETHISQVFLVGDFAYKIKKPIKNSFLDYSTLQKRQHFCHEELRLDRRYAGDMYLGVVPITRSNDQVCVEGDGEAIEYAVKMRRFPAGALLSERLERGLLTSGEVAGLADTIANFHSQAPKSDAAQPFGTPSMVLKHALDNFRELVDPELTDSLATLHVIEAWTKQYLVDHENDFRQRVVNGFIRECHGDLHLANIVHWGDRLVPFDGIEFNEAFRWIDVLNDAAFLAMDLAARGHLDLSRSFINGYLDQAGDHVSLAVLRWYLVYRALVRAKVAINRTRQAECPPAEQAAAIADCKNHIDLAYRFTLREEPRLWITHGLSGSGKTTVSELVVQRHGAIRLRSDIERKRHYGVSLTERPSEELMKRLYSESADHATYNRLRHLASGILAAGYPVIIDATFLRRLDRDSFYELAKAHGADFAILDCHSTESTLRQRVADRAAKAHDASDADVRVLDLQLATQEPLAPAELHYVVDVPDLVAVVSADVRR